MSDEAQAWARFEPLLSELGLVKLASGGGVDPAEFWRTAFVSLAMNRNCHGFGYTPPGRDETADRNWHRRLAMESVELKDRRQKIVQGIAAGLAPRVAGALAASIHPRDLPGIYADAAGDRRLPSQIQEARDGGLTLDQALKLAVGKTAKATAEQAALEIRVRVNEARASGEIEPSYGGTPKATTLEELATKRDRSEPQWRGYPGEYQASYIEAFLALEEHFAQLLRDAGLLTERLEMGATESDFSLTANP